MREFWLEDTKRSLRRIVGILFNPLLILLILLVLAWAWNRSNQPEAAGETKPNLTTEK